LITFPLRSLVIPSFLLIGSLADLPPSAAQDKSSPPNATPKLICLAAVKVGSSLYSDPQRSVKIGQVQKDGTGDIAVLSNVVRIQGSSLYGGFVEVEGAGRKYHWFNAKDADTSQCNTPAEAAESPAHAVEAPALSPTNHDDFAGVHIGDPLGTVLAVLGKAGYHLGRGESDVPEPELAEFKNRKLKVYTLPQHEQTTGDQYHDGIYVGGGLEMERVDSEGRKYMIIFNTSFTPVTDRATFLHESRVIGIMAGIQDPSEDHDYSDLLDAAKKKYPFAEVSRTMGSSLQGTTICACGSMFGMTVQIHDHAYLEATANHMYETILAKTPASEKADF